MAKPVISKTTGQDQEMDVMELIEAVFNDTVLGSNFQHSYMDIRKAIEAHVDNMNADDRTRMLVESLCLNHVTYENERLKNFLKKLQGESKI